LKAPPQPDPRPAILGLRDQLAERGIELVIMPTPVKPSIHAGQMTARLANHSTPLRNRSFDACMDELRAAGVRVFDPAPLMMARKNQGVLYLATDTHWRPEAMQAVAEALAEEVAPLLAERVPMRWSTVEETHRQLGDIATMLDMAVWQTAVDPETVTVKRVVNADGQAWRPNSDSEVLLLGDSFSNIYSLEGMGWGGAGGLAEHLSLALQRPLDRLCRNDAGAHTSRGMLAQALVKDPHFLDGKRVVVWQFAERELFVGDWKMIELAPAPAPLAEPGAGATAPTGDPQAQFAKLVAQAEATDAVAYQGEDDWIFLVSELRHMASRPTADVVPDNPGADPFSALVDLHVKLRELDVQLILLPVPPRAAIYADKLLDDVPRDANGQIGRVDAGLKAFYEALESEGVHVLDLTDSFLAARARDDELGPVCCEQDTHWSPRGIRIAAEAVAGVIAEMDWSGELVPAKLHRGEQTRLEYVGDLVDHIPGHVETASFASIARVVASKDSREGVASDSESPIILLADSHGLVFSSGGEMHCTGAGLAEQIAFELDTTLDVMARRGSGDSVRRDLARRFLRNPDLPATKRVVIYCFAARTFTESTGWKPVPLQR
jgi:lysophospholipase L1-like esterase